MANKKAKRKQTDPTDYFTQALTKKQAKQQARLTARLQVQPARRQIHAEQRAAKLQSKQDAGYFDQYAATIPAAAQKVATAYDTAQGQIASTAKSASDYAEQLRQKLQSEGAADAALRGATYNTGADSTDAQAQLSRLDSSGILSNVTAAQGASAQNLYASKSDTAHHEKLAQRIKDSARERTYDTDLEKLAATEGQTRKSDFTDTIGRERDYQLGTEAAQLGAKSQAQDARVQKRGQDLTAKAAAIRARLTAQSQAETARAHRATEANAARGHNITARQNRYARHHPNAGDNHSPGPNALDVADVQRAGVLLRTNAQKLAGLSEQEVLDKLMQTDQTISRKEALKAYLRWRQHTQQAAGPQGTHR